MCGLKDRFVFVRFFFMPGNGKIYSVNQKKSTSKKLHKCKQTLCSI